MRPSLTRHLGSVPIAPDNAPHSRTEACAPAANRSQEDIQHMNQITKVGTRHIRQTVVLILGMHRSGTSLLSGLINALGVSVGESLHPADIHNPAGYFEDRECVDIQERMLRALGQPWSEENGMLPFPSLWWRQPEMRALVGELEAWIDRRRQTAGFIWALKDPRTTRFIPLWQELLQIRGLNPRYVLAVRDPIEVVASEVMRNNVPPKRVYRTWLRYNMEALLHAGPDLAGIFVYGEWFTDGLTQLRRLAATLDVRADDEELAATLVTVLRGDLYRSGGREEPVAPAWAAYLFDRLKGLSRGEKTRSLAELATEAEYFDALLRQGEEPSTIGPLIAVLTSEHGFPEALKQACKLRAGGARVVLSVSGKAPETAAPGIAVLRQEASSPVIIAGPPTRAAYISWLWLQARVYSEVHIEGGNGLAAHCLDARRYGWSDEHGTIHVHYFSVPAWLDEDGGIRLRDVDDVEILCLERRMFSTAGVRLHADPHLHALLQALLRDTSDRSHEPTSSSDSGSLVSVCITHFNRPAMLNDCLDSIRAQTYPRIEVVLVDDGSTKPTAVAFVESLRDEFGAKGWTLIRQENRYLGAARNAAARSAKGDYLFILDDDNLLRPDGIERAVQIAQQTGADIVTAVMALFRGPSGIYPTWPDELWVFPGGMPLRGLFDNSFGDASALVRRELLLELGGFTEDRAVGGEDWELFAKAILHGAQLEHSLKPLSWYRVDPDGMARSGNPWRDYRRALRPYEATLPSPLRELPALAGVLSRRLTQTQLSYESEARGREEAAEAAARLQVEMAERDSLISQLRMQIAEQESLISQLRMQIAEQELEGAQLRDRIREADARREQTTAELQELIAERTHEYERAIRDHEEATRELAEEVGRHLEELSRLREKVVERDLSLARLDDAFQTLDALHQSVVTSTLWRVTWPIRAVADRVPRPMRRLSRRALKLLWWGATLQLTTRVRQRRAAVPVLAVQEEPQPKSPVFGTPPVGKSERQTLPAIAKEEEQPNSPVFPTLRVAECESQFVQYRIDKNLGLSAEDDVLVYVAYCSDGLLTALQARSVEAYHAEGYRVVLVVNSGMYSRMVRPGQTRAAIEIVRDNVGFDFGAWAHATRLVGGLETARSVTFANDSVIGPLWGTGTAGLRARIDAIDADAVFMTRCLEIREHMQSYFFTFKARALAKGALGVIQNARCELDKEQAIQNEELLLSSRLDALGVSTAEAFPCPDADKRSQNPTIHHWRTLVDAGYPFVKVSLVSAGFLSIESRQLAEVLGTDVLELLRIHLSQRDRAAAGRLADANVAAQPALPVTTRFGPIKELQAYNLPTMQGIPVALPLDDLDGAASEIVPRPAVLAMIHCFYLDEAEGLLKELAALPLTLRTVLTTDTEVKAAMLWALLSNTALHGEVIVCPNRGRNVAPVVIEGLRQLRNETVLLHLHTKKSPHNPDYREWGEVVRRNLVGSPDIVRSILCLLANEGVGIIYSEHFQKIAGLRNWGYDFPHARRLMKRLGVTLSADALLEFPTGTMFWARTEALQPLLDLELSYGDFEPEAGQVDGTLAHAIERCLLLVAESQGFGHIKVSAKAESAAASIVSASCRDIPYLLRRGTAWLLGSTGAWPRFYSMVGEIYPVNVARSLVPGRRLNILIPTMKPEKIYGGVASALRCAKALRAAMGVGSEVRVIVTSDDVDAASMGEIAGRLSAWPVLAEPNDDVEGTVVVDLNGRRYLPLTLRAGDVFFATAWWTADLAFRLRDRQMEMFGSSARVIYMIQDYEPGFYPWSDRYTAAQATYLRGSDTIALINTEELANFVTVRHHFAQAFHIPYAIEQELAAHLRPTVKQKKILVYGRPSTPRNLFDTIVEGVRVWQGRDPDENCTYEMVFVGEAVDDSYLRELENARAFGKLSLKDYAQQLNEAAIGISIMISPHPSYPPLEMAAAGCVTITNRYYEKDLSQRADNIISLDVVTPGTIADALDDAATIAKLDVTTPLATVRDTQTEIPRIDYRVVAQALH